MIAVEGLLFLVLVILSRLHFIISIVVVSQSLSISLALIDLVQDLLIFFFVSILFIILLAIKSSLHQMLLLLKWVLLIALQVAALVIAFNLMPRPVGSLLHHLRLVPDYLLRSIWLLSLLGIPLTEITSFLWDLFFVWRKLNFPQLLILSLFFTAWSTDFALLLLVFLFLRFLVRVPAYHFLLICC